MMLILEIKIVLFPLQMFINFQKCYNKSKKCVDIGLIILHWGTILSLDLGKKIKNTLLKFGYNTEHLIRHVIRIECKNLINNKLPKNMSILEISESEYWKSNLKYKKYTVDQ